MDMAILIKFPCGWLFNWAKHANPSKPAESYHWQNAKHTERERGRAGVDGQECCAPEGPVRLVWSGRVCGEGACNGSRAPK